MLLEEARLGRPQLELDGARELQGEVVEALRGRPFEAVELAPVPHHGLLNGAPRLRDMWGFGTAQTMSDLVELAFGAPSSPRLFGNKDELLVEWRAKIEGQLPLVPSQGADE